MGDTCHACGFVTRAGDTHADPHINSDGTLVISCRVKTPTDESRLFTMFPMPGRRVYFSRIFDPDEWA